jgi:hypothetical protein
MPFGQTSFDRQTSPFICMELTDLLSLILRFVLTKFLPAKGFSTKWHGPVLKIFLKNDQHVPDVCMCLSVYLSLYFSTCLPLCFYLQLFFCLYVCLCICLSMRPYIGMSIGMSVCPFFFLSVCPSLYKSVCLFGHLSACLFIRLSVYSYVCQSVHQSVCVFVSFFFLSVLLNVNSTVLTSIIH